jgi:NAD(P)-dependent dehydrogenase (short-subunit alcohol dehydrogenase family)
MFRGDLLAGRRVVVTGGGSGLGRAMALRFGVLGAKVGVLGRREEPLRETVALLRDVGATATFATADVREPKAVHAAFDHLEAELGPLDTLVNNAAGNFLSCSEDLSPGGFDAVVRIVLHGTFHCTQDFGKRVIADEARKGVILNITTTYAWTGSPFVLPSACAKAGVHAMTKSLATEWAPYGLRVVEIAPGPFPTKGAWERLVPEGFDGMAAEKNPLGRHGDPSELADLATFMISDGGSFLNGETITLDGGEHLAVGQEFGGFAKLDRSALKQIFAAMRPR